MKQAAVAVLLVLAAVPAVSQRGPGWVARVPGSAGGIRIGANPAALVGDIVPERPLKLIPFEGPVPFPPADREWIAAVTPHFIVISSAGERHTRALAEDFEKLTAILTKKSAHFQIGPEKTRVFLFADRRVAEPYFGAVRGFRVDASGITFRHPEGSTMLLDGSARGGDVLTPRHELVHDLLRRRERPLPLWIEEGLAEYYSNAGLPIREHVSRIRNRPRVPLEEVFVLGSDSLRSASFDFYAQSWGAVATLMRSDAKAFFALLDDVEAGTPAPEALLRRYGMSVRALEAAMRAKAGAPAMSVLFENTEPAPFTAAKIERARLLFELGELLSRVESRGAEAERHFRTARPYLDRAHAEDPGRASVAMALFTIYIADGDRTRADELFPGLVASPKVNDARRILLRADLARAGELARDGRLQEAAGLLRDLAQKMPERTRRELETQAAGLEKVASNQR